MHAHTHTHTHTHTPYISLWIQNQGVWIMEVLLPVQEPLHAKIPNNALLFNAHQCNLYMGIQPLYWLWLVHCINYSMACIRWVSLILNCGYAHVCIYQNSTPCQAGQLYTRSSIDISQRELNFRTEFTTYSFPDKYFEKRTKDGTSQFERNCNRILDGFNHKFRGRDSYLATFSHSKWCALSATKRSSIWWAIADNAMTCTKMHSFPSP